jgi:thioredoxin reductase
VETTIEKVRKGRQQCETHDSFVVQDTRGQEWRGRTLVIASGVKDQFPDLPGYADNWPANIHQCLFCDGHERSQSSKGILAYPRLNMFYIKMATMAHFQSFPPGQGHDLSYPPPPSKVTVYTSGPANPDNDAELATGLKIVAAHGIKVDERPIVRLEPDAKEGVHIHFDQSESIHTGFLVHKPSVEPSSISKSLISELGLKTASSPFNTNIVVSPPFNMTEVPGVFAVGDVATPMTHVTVAMSMGSATAGGVAHFCNDLDDELALKKWKESSRM